MEDYIKQNIKTSDIDCEKVDVEGMEQLGQQVMENIQEMVLLNVDLTSAQYDISLLSEEASKLGINLEEFQFNNKCSGSNCFNKSTFKEMDQAVNGGKRIKDRAIKNGLEIYKRATCNPLIKKHVAPIVESIFMTFPFNIFVWPIGIIYDPIASLCCCFLECPWFFCV